MTEASKPSRCPACQSPHITAILYGMPVFDDDLDTALKGGEVVLGGCCIADESPSWVCNDCKHQWGRLNLPTAETDIAE